MSAIKIPEPVLFAIKFRAAGEDEEFCGAILRGEHIPIRNVSGTPKTRFRMDPQEQMEVWNKWRRDGDLIIYHTHPRGSALPSSEDKWVMSRISDVTFLIYGNRCDEFAAYRWNGTDIVSVGIKATQDIDAT